MYNTVLLLRLFLSGFAVLTAYVCSAGDPSLSCELVYVSDDVTNVYLGLTKYLCCVINRFNVN